MKLVWKTYLLIIANRHIFLAIRIVSIIELRNQSILRQNFQYWQSHISTRTIHFFRKHCKITFNYLISQFFSSIFAMFSIFFLSSNFDSFNSFRDIDQFNSNLTCSDFVVKLFNDVTSFLRNLEHCQKLYRYRRTKLLEYMLWILNDFVWKWFKKQSHFNSMSRFEMILTKAFSSQEQRELKSIVQKRAKRKVRKATKRTELKIIETTKKTSKLQNIDTFDFSACNESNFEQYSKITDFLQHFEQCKHLYRKSNLLVLLSKCLCDFAFEWFKIQFEFISLKRFDKILAKTFSKTSVRRASKSSNFQLNTLDVISKSKKNASNQQIVQKNCKICKQNFNFNNELYEHIRNHETLKFVKNSHLSINAINLICEIKKKSFVTHVSSASFARFQKSIFEFTIAFEAVILLKQSIFQFFALEITSESTKKLSMCRHCTKTFNFKKMFRQHKREQHAKKFVVNSHFLINAIKSTCESIEISTINSSSFVSFAIQLSELFTFFELFLLALLDIFNSNRFHQNLEKKRFNQIIIFIQHFQQCQHLCCESKLLEWMKIIFCDFVDIWFENQSNFIFLHDFEIVLTKIFSFVSSELQVSIATSKQKFEFTMIFETVISLKNSHFSYIAPETVLKSKKNESIQCFFISLESSSQTFESKFQEISVQKSSDICSFFSKNTVNSTSEIAKKSSITCSFSSQKSSILSATSKNFVINTNVLLQFVSFKDLHLSITTFEITSKNVETTSDSITEIAKIVEIFAKSIANIRIQIARIRVKLKIERTIFQKSTFEFASKSMKKLSIQQIVCARICKRCKQNFNFNNKFHEHIRQHHARKSTKNSDFRFFTSKSTCKIKKKSSIKCSFVSLVSSIFSATSRSQTISTKIISQFLSSKCSNLSIATYKIKSKSMKSAIVICSLIFSSISSTSVRKHQESHNQKFYLIVNDLSRMFAEKSRSFDLQQHHNRRFSSQNFDVRQHRFASSKKSYLIIENLFEMFDEKFRKTDLFQSRNNVSFQTFSKQSRITIYFKFAINQKSSINRNSKSSKSKNLNQHMFAKSIRIVFSENLFEKSIKLSYKMLDVFDEIFFFHFHTSSSFFDFSSCFRIRFDHFRCKNELY